MQINAYCLILITYQTAITCKPITNTAYEVVKILNHRLDSVIDGKRQREFSKKYRKDLDKIDREYSVVSGHGRDDCGCDDIIEEDCEERVKRDNKLFPRDISSLELPQISPTPYDDEPLHDPSAFQLYIRFCQLTLNFLPCICTSGLALIPYYRNKYWYNLLSNGFAKSGAAFIKWGQWASTRSDMFPEDLCIALSRLHSNAPSHSWTHTRKCVESSLGLEDGTLEDVFWRFDKEPIASGSIAQVSFIF